MTPMRYEFHAVLQYVGIGISLCHIMIWERERKKNNDIHRRFGHIILEFELVKLMQIKFLVIIYQGEINSGVYL